MIGAAAPLAGRRILVTRPEAQAGGLVRAIELAGGEVWLFPLLTISPADPEPVRQVAAHLAEYDFACFVSPNAVEHALPMLLEAGPWPSGVKAVTVGKGSEDALARFGVGPVIAPSGRFDSEALLALPALQADQVAGRRVVIFRGDGGREVLADGLRLRGARVDYVCCYRRGRPDADPQPVLMALASGTLDALTITSSEALENLLAMCPAADAERLRRALLFVPHERIAETARRLGFSHVRLTGAGDAGLIAALTEHFRNPSMTTSSDLKASACAPETMPDNGFSPATGNAAPRAISRLKGGLPWMALGVVVIGLLAWQGWETRNQLAGIQDAMQIMVSRDGARNGQESSPQAGAEERLAALEGRVGDILGQQAAVSSAYEELMRSRAEYTLAEVEQALTIAGQQLQLAGNVEAALIALQAADARLVSGEAGSLLALRRAIGKDIERLRALPAADLSGMVFKLSGLAGAVDQLPLAFESRLRMEPTKSGSSGSRGEPNWATRLWEEFWAEFSSLVRIERLDRQDVAVLAPERAFYLRENLRLRLLSARLALMRRDARTFKEDTAQAKAWVERYFDVRSPTGQQAMASLGQISAFDPGADLPSLAASLAALREARSAAIRGGALANARTAPSAKAPVAAAR